MPSVVSVLGLPIRRIASADETIAVVFPNMPYAYIVDLESGEKRKVASPEFTPIRTVSACCGRFYFLSEGVVFRVNKEGEVEASARVPLSIRYASAGPNGVILCSKDECLIKSRKVGKIIKLSALASIVADPKPLGKFWLIGAGEPVRQPSSIRRGMMPVVVPPALFAPLFHKEPDYLVLIDEEGRMLSRVRICGLCSFTTCGNIVAVSGDGIQIYRLEGTALASGPEVPIKANALGFAKDCSKLVVATESNLRVLNPDSANLVSTISLKGLPVGKVTAIAGTDRGVVIGTEDGVLLSVELD